MHHPLKIIAPLPLPKPAAVAGPRHLALAVRVVDATRRGPVVPVTSRVRDSLVLRVVGRNVPARSAHDERGAR